MSEEVTNATTSNLKELTAAYEEAARADKDYADAIKAGAEAQYGLTQGEQASVAATKMLTTVMTSWNSAFNAAADLAAKNIDELVNLYNAQITMIRTQNTYTQAIALQSAAVAIYGRNSEQATRATTAANYVGALYEQSKKNEVVAANAYATASATNVAKIASSIVDAATSVSQFLVAFAVWRTAHTVAQAQIEMETEADTAATVASQAQTVATTEATTAIVAQTTAEAGLATTMAAGAATAGAAGAMNILPDIETAAGLMGMMSLDMFMQHGGFIPKTGPYILHAGETVVSPQGNVEGVPASTVFSGGGGGTYSPNIEIHIHATSNVDLARIRMEVEAALAKTLLASQKQRGVY
jgi:hypothetical protein